MIDDDVKMGEGHAWEGGPSEEMKDRADVKKLIYPHLINTLSLNRRPFVT